ncbi:unnamed protein product [Urochloa decumbens]|uniref:F-box domain-containing protein n=1 Tax=Urochloa decumbens TaxID=240449 RepID=A0ABC9C0I0_9POAL
MTATAPTQFGPRDFAKLDDPQKMMIQDVYESLPKHPAAAAARAAAAAPLSRAAAAWGPSDGADRLSILPAVLLRNVVSRLPAKDAARTTVLSKRWRRVWHSVPLSLVDAHLLPCADLAAAVSSVLAAHPGPFRTVSLGGAPMDERPAAGVTHWLRLLADKGVKELDLINRAGAIGRATPLPLTLLNCKALVRLYIGFWDFPSLDTLPPRAVFPQLRELGLCSLVMEERDLSFLLERCPVLDRLLIVGSRCPLPVRVRSCIIRCLQICSSLVAEVELGYAPRLESLLLWGAWGPSGGSCWIKVGNAPNLRFLGYLVPGVHHLIVGGTVIKAETKASPSTTVPSVCVLAVQVKLGTHSEVSFLPSILRCFPNTETLYVQCAGDRSREPSLKLFWEDIGPIECINQHLKKLVLCQMQGTGSELQFLKFIANNAHLLEKVVILMGHECAPDDDRVLAKLRYFLSLLKWGSKHCTVSVFRSKGASQGGGIPRCFQRAFNLPNVDPFDDLPRDA